MSAPPLHLAIGLDGAGWHPAAWREPDARPGELFTAGYWLDLVREAQVGLVDLVTIEDAQSLQSQRFAAPEPRTDRVRGRLDAVLIAARVAPLTHCVGLVPSVTATHTEPFHVAKAIATLDYVSNGRAGVRVQASGRPHEARHFGRRDFPEITYSGLDSPAGQQVIAELFDEARDYIEVLRRLWDSWEDDAEIRDATTGRFVDRDRLHYIDFAGPQFSVKGPSITPRPPQGQPLVSVLAHRPRPYRLAATSADLVFVTPADTGEAATIVAAVRHDQAASGRENETLHVFGDLVVFLDDTEAAAHDRRARLDAAAGQDYVSDAPIFAGTSAQLADRLIEWRRAGLTGYRLRPGAVPHDLERITRDLVPELQRRGAFRTVYEADTLRGLLGLSRPANRYAAV